MNLPRIVSFFLVLCSEIVEPMSSLFLGPPTLRLAGEKLGFRYSPARRLRSTSVGAGALVFVRPMQVKMAADTIRGRDGESMEENGKFDCFVPGKCVFVLCHE